MGAYHTVIGLYMWCVKHLPLVTVSFRSFWLHKRDSGWRTIWVDCRPVLRPTENAIAPRQVPCRLCNASASTACYLPKLLGSILLHPQSAHVQSRACSTLKWRCENGVRYNKTGILVIIATVSIHHSFTLSLEAQNLPFQQILPTLTFLLYSLDCLHDDGTGPVFLLHFCSFRVVD